MNARIEAGSLTIGFTAQIVEPTVKVSVKTAYVNVLRSTWTCFNSAPISLNGHSLSAINPESVLNGGMATLAMA
jgi:hypothetical protein